MKQNNNIFEELGRMKNLISTKRGVVISEQSTEMKTDIGTIRGQLNSWMNTDEQLVVDRLKKYATDKTTFQNFLNQYKTDTGVELKDVIAKSFTLPIDKTEIDDLNSALEKIGVKFEVTINEKNRNIASFKGLDSPAVSGVANKDDLWASTYKCVPAQPGVKKFTNKKDGSTFYNLNGTAYYNNGKKYDGKTVTNYSCSTEFKTTNTQQQQQRQQQRQQYLKNVTNYSNEIQTSLGITPTGKLSDADLDKIISSL